MKYSRSEQIRVKNTLASAKSEYYDKKIKASKRNQRTVFSVVNKVLHKSKTLLPNNINSGKDMAHCLLSCSVKKY